MKSLITRTISGIAFAIIMVTGLLVNKFTFAALMLLIMVGCLMEFYSMTMRKRFKTSRAMAIISAVILFLLAFGIGAFGWSGRILGLAFIPVILVMSASLYTKDRDSFGEFANLYTGLLYIAFPLTITNFVVFQNNQFQGIIMLAFFIIVWASDVGAYCFGMALGQKYGKKLFPEISPKKSWIGAIGGFLTAMGVALLMGHIGWINAPWYHCLALGAIMDVFGVYGDLFESQWKRHYAIKDSGNILPGHGGFLDRFDSALFAIPMGVIYLSCFKIFVF
jgi:phosphatidate cytidylyltransferase